MFISIFISWPPENFPPKILVGPSEVNVTINTTATITVVAEDPNNDSLTFTVTGTLPAGYKKSSNDSSIIIGWSVTITKVMSELARIRCTREVLTFGSSEEFGQAQILQSPLTYINVQWE